MVIGWKMILFEKVTAQADCGGKADVNWKLQVTANRQLVAGEKCC